MYCEDCHSDVPDGTIKCPFCGSHLTISKEKHAEKQAEEAERARKPLKWLIIVDIVSILMCIVGGVMMLVSTAPRQVPICEMPGCEELGTVYGGDETTMTYLNGLRILVFSLFIFISATISTIRGFIRAQVNATIRETMEKKGKSWRAVLRRI